MVRVKMKNGDIREVTNNEAHGMIERGEAALFTENESRNTRELTPKRAKNYKTK